MERETSSYVQGVRSLFDDDTKTGIAPGGWGLLAIALALVATKQGRTKFSANPVHRMAEEGYYFVGK
ncbi:hypothetical protein RRF57_006009 [Xylaria bambusicola]|uniref:Uncharacterized protein n=1 Tax=Xylaria bambusicola TaxID=326684 RepID=A0AAN7UN21_9PEZI